ncbi:hypothetical protein ACVVIH_09230 [Chryseobacterium arthrosphaerae]|uniref:hypothetical protein n=1 Tax=Chryseobacterium arthrosphaerae TaxID=651561 RepID=UPI003D346EB6
MKKKLIILFYFLTVTSCLTKKEKCDIRLLQSQYSSKSNVYYDITLDENNTILTLEIINKTGENILILKPEILFLKERIDHSKIENIERIRFETIDFDTVKKNISKIKEYDSIQRNLIDLWKQRKIRQNNNNHFDYGYNIEDYLAVIEKNKSYKEEYYVNCFKTDKGSYKIIFDTSFRNDSLVKNFININFLNHNLSFYGKAIDYPKKSQY